MLSPDQHIPKGLALIALASLKGVGQATLHQMITSGVSLQGPFRSPAQKAWAILKSSGARVDSAQFANWAETSVRILAAAEAELAILAEMGVTILFRDDPAYPPQLNDLKDPPHWLFVRGNTSVLSEASIAAVGTRKPTGDGLWLARFVGLCLGDWKAPTVSGLALGIDQEIHISSIEQGVPTIAVLGTGIFSDYPKNAIELRDQIIDAGGAIVTEYLPSESYSAQNFVHRNRLQAALGRALIPVEWKEKSGTAHTVRYANSLRRPITGLRLPHWHDEGVPPPSELNRTFTIPGQETEFRLFVEAALAASPAIPKAQLGLFEV